MTPAAPAAHWRKVCEEYFSRLIEDIEQQVEFEVDSRVTAAIQAAVQGAVSDAAGESRRALAEELNQAVRRLRLGADADDVYLNLLDVTVPFCDQAAVLSIHENRARAERMRRPARVHAGEGAAAPSLPALEFPVSDAAAFLSAIDTRDPVIAMSTPAEVSPALVRLFAHGPDERVYLFPLLAEGSVAGILYAAARVQAPALELLAEVAGLRLHALSAVPASIPASARAAAAAAGPGIAMPPEHERLVGISGSSKALDLKAPKQHKEWWALTREEQQKHLAAQRFARVQVAEIRLTKAAELHSGRVSRDIYGALKQPIDEARQKFREKHMPALPTVVDYLHLELVRSLADDDAIMLGPDYPGPLL